MRYECMHARMHHTHRGRARAPPSLSSPDSSARMEGRRRLGCWLLLPFDADGWAGAIVVVARRRRRRHLWAQPALAFPALPWPRARFLLGRRSLGLLLLLLSLTRRRRPRDSKLVVVPAASIGLPSPKWVPSCRWAWGPGYQTRLAAMTLSLVASLTRRVPAGGGGLAVGSPGVVGKKKKKGQKLQGQDRGRKPRRRRR
jgi:hypothetical protein